MQWKHLFQRHILARGENYFLDELVTEFSSDEEGADALVCGTEPYEVNIHLEGGQIVEMFCDCPYAESGENCKHMAAVLFCLEDQLNWTASKTKPVPADNIDVATLVAQMDEQTVKNQLIEIWRQYPQLIPKNMFKTSQHLELSFLKAEIRAIFDEHEDDSGFIDYYGAFDFGSTLEEFLQEHIPKLLTTEPVEACELLFDTIDLLDDCAIDDSDGVLMMLLTMCSEFLKELIENSSTAVQQQLFAALSEKLTEEALSSDELEELFFNYFTEPNFLEMKLQFVQQKIEQTQIRKDRLTKEYYLGKWLEYQLDLMEDLQVPEAEIEAFCQQHLQINTVRKYYLADCIRNKKIEQAIKLAQEGKIKQREFWGNVIYYSKQLKELYRMTGDQKMYEKELWSLLVNYSARDLDIFKEARAYYQTNWPTKRKLLFDAITDVSFKAELYVEEQLDEDLLNLILWQKDLRLLNQYEARLKEKYPQQLLEKYASVAIQMAARSGPRSHYRQIVDLLQHMRTYPTGETRVQQLLADWQSSYKNRPAMLDELRKI